MIKVKSMLYRWRKLLWRKLLRHKTVTQHVVTIDGEPTDGTIVVFFDGYARILNRDTGMWELLETDKIGGVIDGKPFGTV